MTLLSSSLRLTRSTTKFSTTARFLRLASTTTTRNSRFSSQSLSIATYASPLRTILNNPSTLTQANRLFTTSSRTMSSFKLKEPTSLSGLKNGDKVEAEVEGIEGGKVLLVKLDDKVHALNANCTHYGAPLKNGILTPEGRLTCPWHGACFSVHTGDVEDAPAPNPLNKFAVEEKDGAIYISGEQSAIKSGHRKPNVRCSGGASKDKVVIVGGGSGGFGAAQALREQGFKGAITLLTAEKNLPLDRTKLSKALIADPSKIEWRDAAWYKDASIDVVQDEVSSVDFSAKSVSSKSGKSFSYSKLILASGGTAKRLPLPGFKDKSNIFVLRTVQDVQTILTAVGEDKSKKITVIGSSFIGMEVANALAKDNTVTVIGMEKAPLERVMGEKVGSIFQSLISKNGVKFIMSASVEGGSESPSDPSVLTTVNLKDGTKVESDLVILGVGVSPETTYLKENSSITLEKDGSIATDESFAVKGLSDVYAIGDIATYPYHGPGGNGFPVRIEHWNVAQNAGRSVAVSVSNKTAEPKPFIPVFWSALGSQLRYCGHTPSGFDDVHIVGEPEEGKFVAYYGKDGAVVAVASMGMDPYVMQAAELMRHDGMPTFAEVKGDKVELLKVEVPKAKI